MTTLNLKLACMSIGCGIGASVVAATTHKPLDKLYSWPLGAASIVFGIYSLGNKKLSLMGRGALGSWAGMLIVRTPFLNQNTKDAETLDWAKKVGVVSIVASLVFAATHYRG